MSSFIDSAIQAAFDAGKKKILEQIADRNRTTIVVYCPSCFLVVGEFRKDDSLVNFSCGCGATVSCARDSTRYAVKIME